jgi:Cu+-exporting ATPase
LKNPIVNSSIQFGLTTVIITLFFHFFKNGFKRLFKLHPNMDSLIAIGSTASYLFGIYYLILIIISYVNKDLEHVSHLRHNLYFDSAAMILVFTSILGVITFGAGLIVNNILLVFLPSIVNIERRNKANSLS